MVCHVLIYSGYLPQRNVGKVLDLGHAPSGHKTHECKVVLAAI